MSLSFEGGITVNQVIRETIVPTIIFCPIGFSSQVFATINVNSNIDEFEWNLTPWIRTLTFDVTAAASTRNRWRGGGESAAVALSNQADFISLLQFSQEIELTSLEKRLYALVISMHASTPVNTLKLACNRQVAEVFATPTR